MTYVVVLSIYKLGWTKLILGLSAPYILAVAIHIVAGSIEKVIWKGTKTTEFITYAIVCIGFVWVPLVFLMGATYYALIATTTIGESFLNTITLTPVWFAYLYYCAGIYPPLLGAMGLDSAKGISVAILLTDLGEKYISKLMPFYIGLAFSLPITVGAMYLGHAFSPIDPIPRTLQMFLVNFFFDGLTLATTYGLLSYALRRRFAILIPLVIILDLGISTIFAWGSLWFGTLGTPHEVSTTSILKIFVGRSIEGEDVNFGPLFWLLHSAFLPTLAYLFIMLIGWIAKLVLHAGMLFSRRASHDEINPFGLTAALLTCFSVVLLGLSSISGFAEEAAKKDNKDTSTNKIQLYSEKQRFWRD